jgi:hypothetical protein
MSASSTKQNDRGGVIPSQLEPEGNVRITIRLDQDSVDRIFQIAEASSGGAVYPDAPQRGAPSIP